MGFEKVDESNALSNFVRRKLNAIMITALDSLEEACDDKDKFAVARKKILDISNNCKRDMDILLQNYSITKEKYIIKMEKEK